MHLDRFMLLVVLAVGCGGGDDGATPLPDATPAPDAVIDAASVATGSFVVHVVERIPDLTQPRPDVAGATVTVYTADGEKRELSTGADGKVTVDAIDWSRAPYAVYATATDHGYSNIVVGLTETSIHDVLHIEDGDVALALAPTRTTVQLSGDLTPAAADDRVQVAPTAGGPTVDPGTATTSYQQRVRAGEPFQVVTASGPHQDDGFESVTRWALFDHAAISSSTTFDLDAATGGTTLEAARASVHFVTATDPAFEQPGNPKAYVFSLQHQTPVGVQIATDTPGDLATEYAMVPNTSAYFHFTMYGAAGAYSTIYTLGPPPAGTTLTAVEPPTTPTGPTSGSAIPVSGCPEGTVAFLLLGGALAVAAPAHTTSLHLPPLPISLGASTTGQLACSGHLVPEVHLLLTSTFGPQFTITL